MLSQTDNYNLRKNDTTNNNYFKRKMQLNIEDHEFNILGKMMKQDKVAE